MRTVQVSGLAQAVGNGITSLDKGPLFESLR